MEEEVQEFVEMVDKLSKTVSLRDYRDFLKELGDELYSRYEAAEADLSRSGED